MTMSNSQRVGDALQLLSKGLAPFVERELKTAYGDDWVVAVLEADPKAHPASAKTASLDDVQFLLKTMWQMWQHGVPQGARAGRAHARQRAAHARNHWAHQETFSTDDAYRVLDSVQRLLTAVSAEEADELDEQKQELLRIRYDEYSRRKSKQVTATLFETADARGPQAVARRRAAAPRRRRRPLPAGRVRRRPAPGLPGRGGERVPRPGRVLPPHLHHRRACASCSRRPSSA